MPGLLIMGWGALIAARSRLVTSSADTSSSVYLRILLRLKIKSIHSPPPFMLKGILSMLYLYPGNFKEEEKAPPQWVVSEGPRGGWIDTGPSPPAKGIANTTEEIISFCSNLPFTVTADAVLG